MSLSTAGVSVCCLCSFVLLGDVTLVVGLPKQPRCCGSPLVFEWDKLVQNNEGKPVGDEGIQFSFDWGLKPNPKNSASSPHSHVYNTTILSFLSIENKFMDRPGTPLLFHMSLK